VEVFSGVWLGCRGNTSEEKAPATEERDEMWKDLCERRTLSSWRSCRYTLGEGREWRLMLELLALRMAHKSGLSCPDSIISLNDNPASFSFLCFRFFFLLVLFFLFFFSRLPCFASSFSVLLASFSLSFTSPSLVCFEVSCSVCLRLFTSCFSFLFHSFFIFFSLFHFNIVLWF